MHNNNEPTGTENYVGKNCAEIKKELNKPSLHYFRYKSAFRLLVIKICFQCSIDVFFYL